MMADSDKTAHGGDGYVSDVSVISNTTKGTNDITSPVVFQGLKLLMPTPERQNRRDSSADADVSPVIPNQNVSSRIQRLKKPIHLDATSEGGESDSESVFSQSILTNTETKKDEITTSSSSRILEKKPCNKVNQGKMSECLKTTNLVTSNCTRKLELQDQDNLEECILKGSQPKMSSDSVLGDEAVELRQSPGDPDFRGCQIPGTSEEETEMYSRSVKFEDQIENQSRPSYNPTQVLEDLFASDCSKSKCNDTVHVKVTNPDYSAIPAEVSKEKIIYDSDSTRPGSDLSQEFRIAQANLQLESVVQPDDLANDSCDILQPQFKHIPSQEADMIQEDSGRDLQLSLLSTRTQVTMSDPQAGGDGGESDQLLLSQTMQGSNQDKRPLASCNINIDEDGNPASSQQIPSSGSRTSSSVGEDRMKSLLCGSQVSEMTTASSDLLLDDKDACFSKTSVVSFAGANVLEDKTLDDKLQVNPCSSQHSVQSSSGSDFFGGKFVRTDTTLSGSGSGKCEEEDNRLLPAVSSLHEHNNVKEVIHGNYSILVTRSVTDMLETGSSSNTHEASPHENNFNHPLTDSQAVKITDNDVPLRDTALGEGINEFNIPGKNYDLMNDSVTATTTRKNSKSGCENRAMELSRDLDQMVNFIDKLEKKKAMPCQPLLVNQKETNASQGDHGDGDLSTQLLDFIVEFSQVSKATSVKSLDLSSEVVSRKEIAELNFVPQRHFSCFGDEQSKRTGTSDASASERSCTFRPGIQDQDTEGSMPLHITGSSPGSKVTELSKPNDGEKQPVKNNMQSGSKITSSGKCGQSGKFMWKTPQPFKGNEDGCCGQGKSSLRAPGQETPSEYGLTDSYSKNLTLPTRPKKVLTEKNTIINLKTRYQAMLRSLKQTPDMSVLLDLLTELKEIQATISHINDKHKSERGKMSARVSQKGLSRTEKKQLKTELQELGARQKQLVEVVHRHKEVNNRVKQMIAEKGKDGGIAGDGGERRADAEERAALHCGDERGETDQNINNRKEGVIDVCGDKEDGNSVEGLRIPSDGSVLMDRKSSKDSVYLGNTRHRGDGNSIMKQIQFKPEKDVDSKIGEETVCRRPQVKQRNQIDIISDRRSGRLHHINMFDTGKESNNQITLGERVGDKHLDAANGIESFAKITDPFKLKTSTIVKDLENVNQYLPATQRSIIDSQQDLFSQDSSRSGCDIDRKVLDDLINTQTQCNEDRAGDCGVVEISSDFVGQRGHNLHVSVTQGSTESVSDSELKKSSEQIEMVDRKLIKRKSVDLDKDGLELEFSQTEAKKGKMDFSKEVFANDQRPASALVPQEKSFQPDDQTFHTSDSFDHINELSIRKSTCIVVCPQDSTVSKTPNDQIVSITPNQPSKQLQSQAFPSSSSGLPMNMMNGNQAGHRKKGFVPSTVKSGTVITLSKPNQSQCLDSSTVSRTPEEIFIQKISGSNESKTSTTSKEASFVTPSGATKNVEFAGIQQNQGETTLDIAKPLPQPKVDLPSPDVINTLPETTNAKMLMSPPVPSHQARETIKTPPEKMQGQQAMLSPCSTAASSDVFPVSCRELVRRIEMKDAAKKKVLTNSVRNDYIAIPVGRIEDSMKVPGTYGTSSRVKPTQQKHSFVQPSDLPVVKSGSSRKKSDLTTLVENGILQPGKDVLSLEIRDKIFQASLNDKGHITGSGGEKFHTPTSWFQAITGATAVKKLQAYSQVLYKGQPLSSFELPNMATFPSVQSRSRPSQNTVTTGTNLTQATGPGRTYPCVGNSAHETLGRESSRKRDGNRGAGGNGRASVCNLVKILSRCTIKLIDDAEIVHCPEIDCKFWTTDFKDVTMSESFWDSVDSWT